MGLLNPLIYTFIFVFLPFSNFNSPSEFPAPTCIQIHAPGTNYQKFVLMRVIIWEVSSQLDKYTLLAFQRNKKVFAILSYLKCFFVTVYSPPSIFHSVGVAVAFWVLVRTVFMELDAIV